MRFSNDQLNDIYDRTSGYCHLCSRKLAFSNYGQVGLRGAWEVEHSTPKSKGGSDRRNNLYAACIPCNRQKGTMKTPTARAWNGRKRAPLSVARRREAREQNAAAGGIVGGFLGGFAGPWGVAVGAAVGAHLGYKANPDRD